MQRTFLRQWLLSIHTALLLDTKIRILAPRDSAIPETGERMQVQYELQQVRDGAVLFERGSFHSQP